MHPPASPPVSASFHASLRQRILIGALWAVAFATALVFFVRINRIHAARAEFVSNLAEWSVDGPTSDPASPTGYSDSFRRYIVPEHDYSSYQWIEQTQQMFARGQWRVRTTEAENAPTGREIHAASPYRWWLGTVAWVLHLTTGRPIGQAVEQAALWADPALLVLLLISATTFVAWRGSKLSAAFLSLGILSVFPFAGTFISGAPNQQALIQFCALWSLLPLMMGGTARSPVSSGKDLTQRSFGRAFFLAGAMGGIGLWISASDQLPLLLGTTLGGLFAAILTRVSAKAPTDETDTLPWRAWALGGAAASLVGYTIEYFPNLFHVRLEVNHPLYAAAWLGCGELLAQGTAAIRRGKFQWSALRIATATLALAAIATLVVALQHPHPHVFPPTGLYQSRLSPLGGTVAANFSAWIARSGTHGIVWATVVPLLLAFAGLAALRARDLHLRRVSFALAICVVLTAALLAWYHLWWWNLLDAALLALVVPLGGALASFPKSVAMRWLCGGGMALVLLAGLGQFRVAPVSPGDVTLTDSETESYIERDLAQWLAKQAGPGGALVLAPPNLSTQLGFSGNLRQLGSPNWENDQGNNAAIRIVSALSPEEANALLTAREVSYLVIPSWDPSLDEMASLGLRAPVGSDRFDQSFIAGLHRWELPSWLRPIPYPLPPTAGEQRTVVILEVVEEQPASLALSRQAEYFIEMQFLDRAVSVEQLLRKFPGDVPALTALAEIELARGDTASATATVNKLLPFVPQTQRKPMAFDRRLSLAILLAQQKHPELAKAQLERCLAEADEAKIRSVTTLSLYRFELLCKRYRVQLADPHLNEFARTLLRPDLRARL